MFDNDQKEQENILSENQYPNAEEPAEPITETARSNDNIDSVAANTQSYTSADNNEAQAQQSNTFQAQQENNFQAQQNTNSFQTGQQTGQWTQPQNAYNKNNGSRYASYEFSQKQEGNPSAPKKKKKKGGIFGYAVKCVVGGLLFGVVAYGAVMFMNHFVAPITVSRPGSTTAISTTTTSDSAGVASTTNYTGSSQVYDVSDVTESVMPSVVAIVNEGTAKINTFFGTQQQDFQSSGSGVIVGSNDEELLIATNNHVIANAEKLTITFDDDSTATAVVKGKSEEMDLAVVAVKLADLEQSTADHIKIATLGDSDALKVGQPAIAIGNALGYGQSVTFGVISALDRKVTVQTDSTYGFGNSQTITNELIQTDAAINPGNSGGALFNINGEVIGINSVKYASSEVEGMGYAIPITEAQPILDDLMNRKTKEKITDESKSAYLGIRGADVIQQAASIYGMPLGSYVVSVEEDSAAGKAGIKEGDIIVKLGDTPITSMENLTEELEYYEAGETVDVVISRSDSGEYKEQTLKVTLGKRPKDD